MQEKKTHITKTMRQKKQYNMMMKKWSKLKNDNPHYVLWIPDKYLSDKEKQHKQSIINKNLSNDTSKQRYSAKIIMNISKQINNK